MRRGIALALALALTAGGALAETGRIVTPKGPANMRKRPEDKAPLVESVPNRTAVEIEELGEEWSRIRYKKQTGYVKTEFLRAPSRLVGKEAYPDGGTVLIHSEAAEDAPVIGVVGCAEKVAVTGIEGDWLILSKDGLTGYAPCSGFSYQLEEPSGAMEWIPEEAVARQDTELKNQPGGKGSPAGSLKAGDGCTVTVIDGDECLVEAAGKYAWAPVSALCLKGAPDTWDALEGMTPNEACSAARAALEKQFKAFAKEKLYETCAVAQNVGGYPGNAYRVGFFSDQGQYLYGALVDAETGKVVFSARYKGFAEPMPEEIPLLEKGNVEISLSADTLGVGDVLRIRVDAWTRNEVSYALALDGAQIVKGEPGSHFAAAFRPRQAGTYSLTVTVKDEAGETVAREAGFTVKDTFVVSEDAAEDADAGVYSQKDGWWKDKKYRHSNLGKSGCAIFALSHALHHLGVSGPDTEPENLAVRYAQFLIPGEGTSNERLINKAAVDFGFRTRGALYVEKAQIISLFESGAVFSFSPARGHIAMADGVSEDGTMVHVVDSAPGATYERIKSASLYQQSRSGAFRAVRTLDELAGATWYFETGEYGALEYWLPMEYITARGLRLIQPISGGEGEIQP